MENLADHASTLVALICLLGVVMLFLRWSQRSIKSSSQRMQNIERTRFEEGPLKHNLGAPQEVTRWEVEMHDLARDLNGQLDTKIAIVNRLLRTAEEQVVRLEQAIQAAQRIAPSAAANSKPADSKPADPKPLDKQDRYREIYSLADAGFTSAAIADQLNLPIGEIDLILGLRKQA